MIIMIVITIKIIIIVSSSLSLPPLIIIIKVAERNRGCYRRLRRELEELTAQVKWIWWWSLWCDGSDAMKNHTQIRPKKSTTVERKSTSLISMINGQPQGVELGRRLGESGGATTIQKLAVQMLSNQVNHHHHHNHHRNQTLIPPAWQHLAVLHIHFQDAGFSIQLLPFCE